MARNGARALSVILRNEPMNRAKFACIRCKRRKTKCSGTFPCHTCVMTKNECVYPKKPRVVKISDTHLDDLYKEIDSLKVQLGVKQGVTVNSEIVNGNNGNNGFDSNIKPEEAEVYGPEIGKTPTLSSTLRSPASEVIRFSLLRHITRNPEPVISPGFSSYIEDPTYNSVLYEHKQNKGEFAQLNEFFTANIDYKDVTNYLGIIVNFLNVGYLTFNAREFRIKLKQYFTNRGDFIPIKPNENDYFLLKILMVFAIGCMYEETTILGSNNYFNELPGIQYFRLVMDFLPSTHDITHFQSSHIASTLDVIEIFGLIAMYLRFVDKKNASCFFTSIALQLCILMNLHQPQILQPGKDKITMENNEYNHQVFWSTYCLNRFFSGRIGIPMLLQAKNIHICGSYEDVPSNNEEFSNTMKYYIDLAKISESINNEMYNNNLNNKDYMNKMIEHIVLLKNWCNNLPLFLQLNITSTSSSPSDRLISSLHLNYLHHIHINCIPIMFHLAKVHISNYSANNNFVYDLSTIPDHVMNLISYVIQSSELTIHIFLKLNEKVLLRCFGFSEIDYLYASSVIFIISVILQIKHINNEVKIPKLDEVNYDFISYLNISLRFLKTMSDMNNRIARAKLEQIVNLIESLISIGYTELELTKTFHTLAIPSLYDFTNHDNTFQIDLNLGNDYIDIDAFEFTTADMEFMSQLDLDLFT